MYFCKCGNARFDTSDFLDQVSDYFWQQKSELPFLLIQLLMTLISLVPCNVAIIST